MENYKTKKRLGQNFLKNFSFWVEGFLILCLLGNRGFSLKPTRREVF